MVLDPIPQSLPVHFSGSRPQPPTSRTECQRCSGCLKSHVIFRKRATNYRTLLRKMTYKDKASYDSTLHCTYVLNSFVYLSTQTTCAARIRKYIPYTYNKNMYIYLCMHAYTYVHIYLVYRYIHIYI